MSCGFGAVKESLTNLLHDRMFMCTVFCTHLGVFVLEARKYILTLLSTHVCFAGSNQLQSLSSLGFSQPLMPRKRRGPLYARTGQVSGKGTSSPQTPESGKAESKGLQQQTQWQTLGNGIFGDHLANSPQGRNSFSTNGLQSSMFAGVQSASLDANGQPLQLQEYTNGLHSGS